MTKMIIKLVIYKQIWQMNENSNSMTQEQVRHSRKLYSIASIYDVQDDNKQKESPHKQQQHIENVQIKQKQANKVQRVKAFSDMKMQKMKKLLQFEQPKILSKSQKKPFIAHTIKLQFPQKDDTQKDESKNQQYQVHQDKAGGAIHFNPEQDLFSKNKLAYLNIAKGVFIIHQVIDPIQGENLLDYTEEPYVQFLFLVSVRAKNYLNSAKKLLLANNEGFKQSKQMKTIIDDAIAFYEKAEAKFKIYNLMLEEIRSKIGNKISSLLHLKRKITGKQVFLDGFQGLDYTQAQQVQFTHCKYIDKVLNSKQIKNPYFKNHRFKKVLRGYRECCEIKQTEITSEKEMKNRINEIIIEQ